jgi:hypothetical protein
MKNIQNIPTDKKLILLGEYKEGFGELAKLVDGFEGIRIETQLAFVDEAEISINEQLVLLDKKKEAVLNEVKDFLAKYNSRFMALVATEKYLADQLEYYKSMRKVIINENDDGQQKEKAAI